MKNNKKNNKFIINRDELYSATSLVNYIRSDCIVDLIEILGRNNYQIDIKDNLNIKKIKDINHVIVVDLITNSNNIPQQNKRKR